MSKLSKPDCDNLQVEIKLHSKLVHENIIKYYDALQVEKIVYILLEYAPHKVLFFYIHPQHGLEEKLTLRFLYQTALAVKHLHDSNIIHRDIKPENILLGEELEVKLCDFGWSCYMQDEDNLRTSICGTYEYMAPEIVNEKGHNSKADVWCLGILMFEMLTGSPPFQADSMTALRRELRAKKIPISNKWSGEIRNLIVGMLTVDASKRLSIDQVLAHPAIIKHVSELISPLSDKDRNTLMQNYHFNTQGDKEGLVDSVKNFTRSITTQKQFSEPVMAGVSSTTIITPEQKIDRILEIASTSHHINPPTIKEEKKLETVQENINNFFNFPCEKLSQELSLSIEKVSQAPELSSREVHQDSEILSERLPQTSKLLLTIPRDDNFSQKLNREINDYIITEKENTEELKPHIKAETSQDTNNIGYTSMNILFYKKPISSENLQLSAQKISLKNADQFLDDEKHALTKKVELSTKKHINNHPASISSVSKASINKKSRPLSCLPSTSKFTSINVGSPLVPMRKIIFDTEEKSNLPNKTPEHFSTYINGMKVHSRTFERNSSLMVENDALKANKVSKKPSLISKEKQSIVPHKFTKICLNSNSSSLNVLKAITSTSSIPELVKKQVRAISQSLQSQTGNKNKTNFLEMSAALPRPSEIPKQNDRKDLDSIRRKTDLFSLQTQSENVAIQNMSTTPLLNTKRISLLQTNDRIKHKEEVLSFRESFPLKILKMPKTSGKKTSLINKTDVKIMSPKLNSRFFVSSKVLPIGSKTPEPSVSHRRIKINLQNFERFSIT